MGTVSHENVKKVMTYQKAEADQLAKFEAIRQPLEDAVTAILDHVPDCADKTVAIRCIREARMWANAAIALRAEI